MEKEQDNVSLDAAYALYVAGRMMRKDMFRHVIDAIAAMRAELEAIKRHIDAEALDLREVRETTSAILRSREATGARRGRPPKSTAIEGDMTNG